ncbi:MAG: elongation factor G [Chloroflexi bacterium]|nr:elongation factor G [Chloroflexota bacterium]
MPRAFPLERVRNIGIIAHIDAGKTTVSERILYYTGRTYKMGEVHEGTAVMDWMPQERERGITITAAATTANWREHQVNIIDTPGHVDFTVEVERSLRVLDGGVVVFDAVAGVEPQSETVWRQADKYRVPRVCFINKMDRVGADYPHTIRMIADRLQAVPCPIQYPLGREEAFQGMVDLMTGKAWVFGDDRDQPPQEVPVPEECREEVAEYHRVMVERISETDDVLLEAYVEGREVSGEQLKQALRRATIAARLVPVLCGSALKNKGVRALLDAVVDYLPSPLDVPPLAGENPRTGQQEERPARDEAPFSALVFKIVSDPYIGRLAYLRVYSGVARTGAAIYNTNQDRRERFGRLVLMHANRREEVEELPAGSIGAAVGLKSTYTGDTICDPQAPVRFESIVFPEPVISMAIEPKSKADEDRLGEVIQRLTDEDPTFHARFDAETSQTIISGMGELHLDIIADRMLREYRLEARLGRPQVAYKETVTAQARAQGRFVRQSGGRGQYGDVWLEVEPREPGQGFEFVNKVVGGTVPREFVPAVEAGVRDALQSGPLAGYPVVDIRVALVDGSYHEVDSSELAFKMAGAIGLKAAIEQAQPVLLEPIMKMEVVTPDSFLGAVLGDLSSRRAVISGIETRGNISIIPVHIPLAETFGYTTDLRSLTEGRASSSMEFARYQPVSPSLVDEIMERGKGRRVAQRA